MKYRFMFDTFLTFGTHMYIDKRLMYFHWYLRTSSAQSSLHIRMTLIHWNQAKIGICFILSWFLHDDLSNKKGLVYGFYIITFSLSPKLLKLPMPFELIFLIFEPKLSSCITCPKSYSPGWLSTLCVDTWKFPGT